MAIALERERYREDHRRIRALPHPIEPACLPVLAQFACHSLEEQITVNLADRTDSKYLLPITVLPQFLTELRGDHTVLTSNQHNIFTYENTYFDTPNWDLYLNHHNGKLNRHKWRFRRYHETDVSYLEYKLKNNKRRTVKTRVSAKNREAIQSLEPDIPDKPSLYVNYRRITLWNRSTDERLTVDFDLKFQRPQNRSHAQLPNIFVAELKRDGKPYGSTFVRRAKDFGFIPQSFSKYCVGACLTDDGALKKNRFKPILNKVRALDRTGELK